MAGFIGGSGFTPVSIVAPATPPVVFPLQPFLVSLRLLWRIELHLHGIHGQIHM